MPRLPGDPDRFQQASLPVPILLPPPRFFSPFRIAVGFDPAGSFPWDSILPDLFCGSQIRSLCIFRGQLPLPPAPPPSPFLLRQKVHLAARVDIFIDFVYFIVLCFLFLLLLRFFVVVVAVTKQNKRRTQLQNQSNERIRERERIRKRMEPSEMRKNCQHQQITDCTSTLDGSAGSGRKCRKSRMLNQVAYLIAYPSLER